MKDNFCIVPWIHLNPEPSGAVKPCCAYFDAKPLPKLQDMSLEEIWNSDFQKNIRKQFLNNEVPSGCKSCVKREDQFNHSLRMAMNERFSHHIETAKKNTTNDGHYEDFKLYYWDFRFSNICNFKCRMCGHGCSSQWYEETLEAIKHLEPNRPKIMDSSYYGTDLTVYVDKFIDIVEEIYFAGGEPLLMPEHYKILDVLLEKQRFDVFLRYNTNLSTIKYKSYDLIQIWKQFEKVEIYASIDGFGANAEYSRNGTDWPRVEQNLISLINSGIDFKISLTVNIFNVFHIPDLLLHLSNLGLNLGNIIPNILTTPSHYNVSILPDDLKNKVKEKYNKSLENFSNNQKKYATKLYDGIILALSMSSNEKDIDTFYNVTSIHDKNRGEDILSVIPEYVDWFNNIKNKREKVLIYFNGDSFVEGAGLSDHALFPNDYPGNFNTIEEVRAAKWGDKQRKFIENDPKLKDQLLEENKKRAFPNYVKNLTGAKIINAGVGGSSMSSIAIRTIWDLENLVNNGTVPTHVFIGLTYKERIGIPNVILEVDSRTIVHSILPDFEHLNLLKQFNVYAKAYWMSHTDEQILVNHLRELIAIKSYVEAKCNVTPIFLNAHGLAYHDAWLCEKSESPLIKMLWNALDAKYLLNASSLMNFSSHFVADGHVDENAHKMFANYIVNEYLQNLNINAHLTG